MEPLPQQIEALERSGPKTHARWSSQTWRHVCAGPATTLWKGLASHPDKERVLVAYLSLLHSGVGLQYLSVDQSGRVDPTKSFLARAFCEVLPVLLPECDGQTALNGLAATWNVGERLQMKASWLDRYLAARLVGLEALDELATFLERVIAEGLVAGPPAKFTGEAEWQVLDCAATDRRFLPGECHLATPAIACVHDRLRPDAHEAILLRPGSPAISLGATACLGRSEAFASPPEASWSKYLKNTALPDPCAILATTSGFILVSTIYSQRLWIGRVA